MNNLLFLEEAVKQADDIRERMMKYTSLFKKEIPYGIEYAFTKLQGFLKGGLAYEKSQIEKKEN